MYLFLFSVCNIISTVRWLLFLLTVWLPTYACRWTYFTCNILYAVFTLWSYTKHMKRAALVRIYSNVSFQNNKRKKNKTFYLFMWKIAISSFLFVFLFRSYCTFPLSLSLFSLCTIRSLNISNDKVSHTFVCHAIVQCGLRFSERLVVFCILMKRTFRTVVWFYFFVFQIYIFVGCLQNFVYSLLIHLILSFRTSLVLIFKQKYTWSMRVCCKNWFTHQQYKTKKKEAHTRLCTNFFLFYLIK